jgi:hypothetical protein
MNQVEQIKEAASPEDQHAAETYYQADDSYKYYSIIYTEDYTGAGLWPSQEEVETSDSPGFKYPIGSGCQIFEAVQARDQKMVDIVLKYQTAPDTQEPKKLKLLELGSGRGGLTRFMA